MKLNLGCANAHEPGYWNVDLCPPADELVDLSYPWPWTDSSIEEILARDIAEHIPDWPRHPGTPDWQTYSHRHWSGRIHFLNECHRVLIPGGLLVIEVPSASHGAGYAQDPTHVQPYTLNSFQYFQSGSFAHMRLARSYGITAAFDIIELGERMYRDVIEDVWKITARLRAVK